MKREEIIITKINSFAVIAVIVIVFYDRLLQWGSLLNTTVHYPIGIKALVLNQAQR